MRVRTYGTAGPLVIVIHGGPGAAGSMAPVARELADRFRVLEPFQRRSGAVPIGVADHVEDLRDLVSSCDSTPALLGSSWGAMLALAFAAAHPDLAGPLVLVGCGTFDLEARAQLQATIQARMNDELRRRMESLQIEISDPDARLRALVNLLLPVYSHDVVTDDLELAECDGRAAEEVWADLVRLQREGVYPAAFRSIRGPVLMLHGTVDPHPGRMILAGLKPHIPQIEYREWEHCGHYPWLERSTREEFSSVVKAWLSAKMA